MAGGAGIAYEFWIRVADAGIKVNVGLAVLNLFPLLPLDGGRILASLLPASPTSIPASSPSAW